MNSGIFDKAMTLINTAVSVLNALSGLGVLPDAGISAKIIQALGTVLLLVKNGEDAANDVINELNDLNNQLAQVQTAIDNGDGADKLVAEFKLLSDRADNAVARIQAAAASRGLT